MDFWRILTLWERKGVDAFWRTGSIRVNTRGITSLLVLHSIQNIQPGWVALLRPSQGTQPAKKWVNPWPSLYMLFVIKYTYFLHNSSHTFQLYKNKNIRQMHPNIYCSCLSHHTGHLHNCHHYLSRRQKYRVLWCCSSCRICNWLQIYGYCTKVLSCYGVHYIYKGSDCSAPTSPENSQSLFYLEKPSKFGENLRSKDGGKGICHLGVAKMEKAWKGQTIPHLNDKLNA